MSRSLEMQNVRNVIVRLVIWNIIKKFSMKMCHFETFGGIKIDNKYINKYVCNNFFI